MESYQLDNLEITIDRKGAGRFTKASYPIRYGRFGEIKTSDYLFQFNLNGEIKYIQGLNGNWPHPAEWLKRTDADDWVYYSTGGYSGVFDLLGEYYRPCLPYPSNPVWVYDPFADTHVRKALTAWSHLPEILRLMPINAMPDKIKNFLNQICNKDADALRQNSERLHQIIGTHISVLPPDTRHVDYELIPLIIADGCFYHCDFCCLQSQQRYRPRTKRNILQQISQLKTIYGPNLKNYTALFLGNHDGLAAGYETVMMATVEAYQAFGFENAYVKDPVLFLFGSVDSFLNAENKLLEALNRMPMATYINIGFESADAVTLARLNKPLDIQKIRAAFQKLIDVNRSHANIEVTANFLLGDRLGPDHYGSIIELVRHRLTRIYSKGSIYLSPLMSSRSPHDLRQRFVEIKKLSRLPTYLYLIQRL